MDMKKLQRLKAISRLSHQDKKWKHRDIFRTLSNLDIWKIAYQNVKRNKNRFTSKIKTLNQTSVENLNQLQTYVYSEKYKFTTGKKKFIDKVEIRKKPLKFSKTTDKIVQEVICMILEAIYEPVFLNSSFGFRSDQGSHSALKHIEKKFRWVDWTIENDKDKVYPILDNKVLITILEKRVNDPRFIRLIRKLLKSDVLENFDKISSANLVPKENILASILVNIYYYELDEYVEKLSYQYFNSPDKITERKNIESKTFEFKISTFSKKMSDIPYPFKEYQHSLKKFRNIRKNSLMINNVKERVTRIQYTRYLNNWIIGITGDQKMALQFKDKISDFKLNNLNQSIYRVKTKITNLRTGNINFLGYEIFLIRNWTILRSKKERLSNRRKENPKLRFDVPISKLEKQYIEYGYLKRTNKRGVRPISKSSYTCLEDHLIVTHFRKLWLQIYNYYIGSTDRGKLQYFHYLFHISCAMTLGQRHRMSCSKIFKKHGKNLRIQIPNTENIVSFPYKMKCRFNQKRWFSDSEIMTLF